VDSFGAVLALIMLICLAFICMRKKNKYLTRQ
jgi:hypothetical protein